MSVKIIGEVFDLEMEPTKKFILIAYVDHADHGGNNIYPAVATIAAKTGYSERTVQRVTRELEIEGYLIADGKGAKGTNKWKYGRGDTVSGVTPATPGGDNEGIKGVTTTTKGGDKLCHPNRPLTVNESPIKGIAAWDKISEVYSFEKESAFMMLSPHQQQNILPLLEQDGQKCVKIAVYYRNKDATFRQMIGGILNNFDTWRDATKQDKRKEVKLV